MKRLHRLLAAVTAAFVLCAACADRSDDAATDTAPANSGIARGVDTTAALSTDWPAEGAARIDVRRSRAIDLTRDGTEERVVVSARGPAYDSLDIDLAIVSAGRDTLWLERWSSLHYFKYTPLEELADSSIVRIVQGHVDALLADSSFTTAGMPPALSHGETRPSMREAVSYHLAELDWRRNSDLKPQDPTPPEAYQTISVDHVAPGRTDVVIDELLTGPAYMYYAGGEATYAIGWSEREHAFVRLYSCC